MQGGDGRTQGDLQLVWFAKRRTTADGLLGIETGPEGIALARVQRLPGEVPRLLDCLFRQATPAEQPALLKSLVAERALGHDDLALAADRVAQRLRHRGAHELVVGGEERMDVDLIERRNQRVDRKSVV